MRLRRQVHPVLKLAPTTSMNSWFDMSPAAFATMTPVQCTCSLPAARSHSHVPRSTHQHTRRTRQRCYSLKAWMLPTLTLRQKVPAAAPDNVQRRQHKSLKPGRQNWSGDQTPRREGFRVHPDGTLNVKPRHATHPSSRAATQRAHAELEPRTKSRAVMH